MRDSRKHPLIRLLVCVALTAPWCASALADTDGFEPAIDKITPAVVKLYGTGAGAQAGYGTGVLVSPDGHVLTVLSLLIEAPRVRVVDWQGRRYEADVLHRDEPRQLALLQLKSEDRRREREDAEPIADLPYVDLTKEATLRPGDWIVAAGNAFKVAEGAEPVSVAHGVFSARTRLDARRRVRDFPYRDEVLVIDAITSNPGGPGSAVVNLDGEFVGMIGRFVVSNLTHTHFNYAMPRDVLLSFYEDATDPEMQGTFTRVDRDENEPFDIGLRLAKVGYRQVLPFVERVKRDSPAAQAGIRKDDLILSVNGRTVSSVDEYEEQMTRVRPDEAIDIVVRRGGRIVPLRIESEDRS